MIDEDTIRQNKSHGHIYYLPKGTTVRKKGTKRDRPSPHGLWLTALNSWEDDTTVFYDYEGSFSVDKSWLLQKSPAEFVDFRIGKLESFMKSIQDNWGFGDEGERGLEHPRLKGHRKDLEEIRKLRTTL